MNSLFLYLGAGALALLAGAATASPTLTDTGDRLQTAEHEATIASTRQFDFKSAINGEGYRIQVFVPNEKAPPAGFPVLYVLDGNVLFGTFANAARNRSQAGEIAPAVIVGIASGEGSDSADRTRDFSSYDMTAYEKTIVKDLGDNPPYGGSDKFFRVIQEEIKPRIARIAQIDAHKSMIFGWSLGGLFVVHTMLTHANAFSAYAALSPSLWRSDRAVFRDIPVFEQRVAEEGKGPCLFLGAGSLEEDPNSTPLRGWTQKDWAAEMSYAHMVRNGLDMAAALRGFFASHSLLLEKRVFSGDTHNSVPWTAINPVLDFALGRQTNEAPRDHQEHGG